MINRYKLKTVFLIGIIVLLLIPFTVWFPNRFSLVFVPEVFLTEYFKIIGGLIPIIFGFSLVNYYWDRKVSMETYEYLLPLIENELKIIQDNMWEIGIHSCSHSHTIVETDKLIEEINTKRKKIKNAYINLKLFISKVLKYNEEKINTTLLMYMRDIKKPMEEFLNYDLEKLSPSSTDFNLLITKIGQLTKKTVDDMNEGGK